MEALLSATAGGKPKPTLAFVGATVQDGLAATAQQMGWMEAPLTVAVGQVTRCALTRGVLRLPGTAGGFQERRVHPQVHPR